MRDALMAGGWLPGIFGRGEEALDEDRSFVAKGFFHDPATRHTPPTVLLETDAWGP